MIEKKRINNINYIKKKTGDAKDITFKDYPIKNKTITFIYSKSASNSNDINDFILRRLDEDKNNLETKDIYNYIKNYIPNNSGVEINNIDDTFYYLFTVKYIFL